MTKSDIKIIPEYGKTYLLPVSNQPLLDQLPTEGIQEYFDNLHQLEALKNSVYATGKWTVKQIIEHITDAERVFQYRALRFVRQDKTPLSGFDENLWVAVSKANDKPIENLMADFLAVRQSTVRLFQSLTKEELFFTGKANNTETSVIALGFMMIGHAKHHFKVIEERYFPLLKD